MALDGKGSVHILMVCCVGATTPLHHSPPTATGACLMIVGRRSGGEFILYRVFKKGTGVGICTIMLFSENIPCLNRQISSIACDEWGILFCKDICQSVG
ncbi:hypothetical protein AAC387_Pa01g2619 [Persea americana]